MSLDNASLAEFRDEIAQLVDQYPYSGPFRMLLAKASKEAGHLNQREDLLAAAAHCTSRKALFDIMFSDNFVEKAKEIHKEIEALDDVEEDELIDLIWHPSGETSGEPQIESSVELDDGQTQEREEIVEAISSVLEEKSEEIFQQTEEEAQVETEFDSEEPQIREVGKADSLFGKWLLERAKATDFGESKKVEARVERGAAAIIDAFLSKDNPQIGKVRDVTTPVEEWANKGLEENEDLVTETMAKLYAKQGQIGRARKAFKLLALKYPDKSVYFAAQLKKLIKK